MHINFTPPACNYVSRCSAEITAAESLPVLTAAEISRHSPYFIKATLRKLLYTYDHTDGAQSCCSTYLIPDLFHH